MYFLDFNFFSLSKSLSNVWLVKNWSEFVYDIGFISIDSNYQLNLIEFFKQILIIDKIKIKAINVILSLRNNFLIQI